MLLFPHKCIVRGLSKGTEDEVLEIQLELLIISKAVVVAQEFRGRLLKNYCLFILFYLMLHIQNFVILFQRVQELVI